MNAKCQAAFQVHLTLLCLLSDSSLYEFFIINRKINKLNPPFSWPIGNKTEKKMNWRMVCTIYFVSEGKIYAFQGLWTIWQHSKTHSSKSSFSWLREISLSQQAWQHVSGIYMLQGENNCMFRINSSQHSLPWILLNKLLQLSFGKNVTDTNIVSLFWQIPCFCLWYASILHKTKKQKHWLGPLASRSLGFTWALLINCSWFPWWLWHSWCFMFHGKLPSSSYFTNISHISGWKISEPSQI